MKAIFLVFLAQICLVSSYNLFQPTSSHSNVIYAGSTKPLPSFDPLGFSAKQERIPFFREAELKHGRIGMVSALSIPLVEQITHRPAIFEFQKLPSALQMSIVGLMFMAEFSSMIRGWENPTKGLFKVRDDYQPGDLGFSLYDKNDEEGTTSLLNKELNNGRLAMIASLGMIAQELVTRQTLV